MKTAGVLFTMVILFFLTGCAFFADPAIMGEEHKTDDQLPGIIFINEIALRSSAVEEEDWVELYNWGDASIDLDGFYLSDDPLEPLKWALPGEAIIPARGFLLIICSGADTGLQSSFGLKDGDSILLTTPNGSTLIDEIAALSGGDTGSYGRLADGASIWTTLTTASPGESNNE